MDKKKAAVLTGVIYFLQQEQAEQQDATPWALPEHHINPWTFYGRRTTARLNNLVQSGAYRKQHICPYYINPEKGRLLERAKNLAMKSCRPVTLSPMKTTQPNTKKKENQGV